MTESAPEAPQGNETPTDSVIAPTIDSEPSDEQSGDSFGREYVERLRRENADYRTKAKEADERLEPLNRELFLERVKATGRLADPADLPFDAEAVNDREKLDRLIADLLTAKPHFASRKPTQPIGQGVKDQSDRDGSWLSSLKAIM